MSTDERMKLADKLTAHVGRLACVPMNLPLSEWNIISNNILSAAAALRAPEAADAGAVAAPMMWVCFAADTQFIRARTKDGVRAARFVEEGLDMIALCASPTAAGIAAPAAGVADRETLAQVFEDICEALGVTSNEAALEEIERLKSVTAPPAASADAVRKAQSSHVTQEDREYASELLADLNSGDLPRLEIAAQWFRKARVEHALSAPVAGADAGMRERADENYDYVCFSGPAVDAINRRTESDDGPTEGQVTADARAFVETNGVPRFPLSPDAQRPNTGGEELVRDAYKFDAKCS